MQDVGSGLPNSHLPPLPLLQMATKPHPTGSGMTAHALPQRAACNYTWMPSALSS